ncbi:MAG: NADH-quinone oxidoreductase subunit M [Fimbriiglobus sp.]|nr:NADH-quinone oxidoreductase subunit M [Fimbriiglobus sp.]
MDSLYDNLFAPGTLRVLLMVVMFAPLGFAALVALTGERFRAARRLSGLFAALHLMLTIFLVAVAAMYSASHTHASNDTFCPIAVPGDSGEGTAIAGGSQEHRTSWNLFMVGKPDPKVPSVPPAVQFFVGLDGLNMWLILLASIMTYVAVSLSWHSAREKAGGYYAWVFVLQTAVTGAFASFDVILFYVFFELTLIPTFFLIGGWGVGGGKRDAARKFFLYTLFGSLFSLIGLIGIVYTNPTFSSGQLSGEVKDLQMPLRRGPVSFSINQLIFNTYNWRQVLDGRAALAQASAEQRAAEVEQKRQQNAADLSAFQKLADEALLQSKTAAAERDRHSAVQGWLFFALIAGFVVKTPLVPFHTWLPAAYAEAPTPVTMLLSAVLAKLGTLGLLRIVIPLCPDMAVQYGLPVFGTLGAIGIVYAAFCAFNQKDVKLMAAYSSVSHLGLLVLGMFALNSEGLTGATLHMVNHGLSAGATFALLAVLHDRYGTTDMTQLGGLWSRHTKFAFFLILISLAAVGLPGTNNFITEMLLIGGLFKPWAFGTVGYWLAIAAASGILLSAWYTFTMLRNVLFGNLKIPTALPDGAKTGDLTGRELWALLLPTLGCVVLGVYPQPVLDSMRHDVATIEKVVNAARMRVNPTLAELEKTQPPADEPDGVHH